MKTIFLALLNVFALTSFAQNHQMTPSNNAGSLSANNPFSSASKLPFGAPAFNTITNADYQPAIEAGMQAQQEEIEKIANNPAAPTFENTFAAMEKSGQLLSRVTHVFNLVTGANTNDTLQKLQEAMAPKLAANQDATYLNAKLFKRIETVYQNRAKLHLDSESNRLVEYQYQQFVLAGAKLSDEDKTALKKLNEENASLSAKFTNQLLNAAKNGALLISDSAQLAGISESDKAAFAQNAKAANLSGKWLIPLQNTTQQPLLQSLTNRATRQQLFEASWTRAARNDSNDTRATILRLAAIRVQRAKLMGFPDYATWKLQDQMA